MGIGIAKRNWFEQIEIDIGSCFLIPIVVSVSLYESPLTEIDSKS